MNNLITNVREASGAKNIPTTYSQGQHRALTTALGFLLADSRTLHKINRIKREALQSRLSDLEARFNKLFEDGGDIDQLKFQTRSDRALIENAIRRIGVIEAIPRLEYRGVWNADTEFLPGNVVTCDGSSWFCRATSRGVKPGTDPALYVLMTKRGKDGRDAKGT